MKLSQILEKGIYCENCRRSLDNSEKFQIYNILVRYDMDLKDMLKLCRGCEYSKKQCDIVEYESEYFHDF